MKIAVTGKGGVGKTTLSAMLAAALGRGDRTVVAIDADPDSNLAAALGVPVEQHPVVLSEMRDLVAERTGSRSDPGGFFRLNPKVDDIPDEYAVGVGRIRLLALGGVNEGGGGCICPASALVKALLSHLILGRDDAVVMDMEAGIEHLGRATAQSMDALLIVVDGGPWSRQTARRIRKLAGDLGMTKLFAVVNRAGEQTDLDAIAAELGDLPIIGRIAQDDRLAAGVMQPAGDGAYAPTNALADHLATVEALLAELKGRI